MRMFPTFVFTIKLKLKIIRLLPGEDLLKSLRALTDSENIRSGFILTCAGSLSSAVVRYAGSRQPVKMEKILEIISLSGTLCPDGLHLHISVSDEDGITTGGHLMQGCIIRTTAEIVIGESPDHKFSRKPDPATGFKELVIEKVI